MRTKGKNSGGAAASEDSLAFCQHEIDRMLKNSQTKVIAPVITLAVLRAYIAEGRTEFPDREIQKRYDATVEELKSFLGHDVHIGAKYYDAYGIRMARYKVLTPIAHLRYVLTEPYKAHAVDLCSWIPRRIAEHINLRLGIVPQLSKPQIRTGLADDAKAFLQLVAEQITKTAANFEIFSFAVLKVHLQKFACRIYRDTRTAAHDHGVDLSTNFGVVYQVKKLQIMTEAEAKAVCVELRQNFNDERMQDGNVVLVIDDIAKDMKQYLINMKVQSITKSDVLRLAAGLDDPEDRQKVLRVVYEEFRREYCGSPA
jgi:hypothetical protein